jgi:hypothetical protein
MKLLYLTVFVGVSSTVLDFNAASEGFVVSYTIMGESTERLTLPINIDFDDGSRVWESGQDIYEYWNLTTIDNAGLIVASLLTPGESGPEFVSVFTNDFVTHCILIPIHGQLVINPDNPEGFVRDGIWVRTRSTNDDFPQVSLSVSLVPNTLATQGPTADGMIVSSQNFDYRINPTFKYDVVPSVLMMDLFNEFQRLGIDTTPTYLRDGRILCLAIDGNVTNEIIDSLPAIRYHVHTDSGTDVMIHLYGRDYVGPISPEDNRRRLEVISVPNTGFVLGRTTLSNIALSVDNRDKTIAIGEPL